MNPTNKWYESKKFLAYTVTLILTLTSALLGLPEHVVGPLAQGLSFALPVLLGGQAAVDALQRKP